jgi:hypothetical protein
MKKWGFLIAALFTCATAYAGFQGYSSPSQSIGVFNKLVCSTGLTCTKSGTSNDKFVIVSSPTNTTGAYTVLAAASTAATLDIQANNNATSGDDWQLKSTTSEGGLSFLNNTSGSLVQKALLDTSGDLSITGTLTPTGAIIPSGGINGGSTVRTRYHAWVPQPVTNASSVTGSATVVYLTQLSIPYNMTLTGAAVLNAATVGTNKWILALFNSSGTPIANTALAGTTTSGASAFQPIAFTSTVAVTGPGTYWVGLYVNGTTDTYYSIPTLGQSEGLAGSVSSQTFGTVASVTLPTTFTAGVAPVVYVY